MVVNATRSPKHRIRCNAQIVLWFAGLRGAIAFSLSHAVPTENHSEIYTTTVVIVLFSVLILGGMTIPVLKALGIKLGEKETDGKEEKLFTKENKFLKFDRLYFKPMFTKRKSSPEDNPQNIEDQEIGMIPISDPVQITKDIIQYEDDSNKSVTYIHGDPEKKKGLFKFEGDKSSTSKDTSEDT
jgi:hypothetical protein